LVTASRTFHVVLTVFGVTAVSAARTFHVVLIVFAVTVERVFHVVAMVFAVTWALVFQVVETVCGVTAEDVSSSATMPAHCDPDDPNVTVVAVWPESRWAISMPEVGVA
jgi:hypothetical protein